MLYFKAPSWNFLDRQIIWTDEAVLKNKTLGNMIKTNKTAPEEINEK